MTNPGPLYRTVESVPPWAPPRYVGQSNDEQRALAMTNVELWAAKYDNAYVEGPDATGSALIECNRVLEQAGILPDWIALKGRSRSLLKRIPGHLIALPNVGIVEQLDRNKLAELRAWTLTFALDLIDPAAQQTREFAVIHDWW